MRGTSKEIAEIRRHNLHQLVLQKFDGKRAPLARASLIHPNQINLMLSDNEQLRRPMTDHIAQKMETNLSLPEGFFSMEGGVRQGATYTIHSFDVPTYVADKFAPCKHIRQLVATPYFVARYNVQNPAALVIAEALTDEMAPAIEVGDQMVVELMPQPEEPKNKRKELAPVIERDGIYILAGANGVVMMRQVQRGLRGGYLLTSPNPAIAPNDLQELGGIRVLGRVCTTLKFT